MDQNDEIAQSHAVTKALKDLREYIQRQSAAKTSDKRDLLILKQVVKVFEEHLIDIGFLEIHR